MTSWCEGIKQWWKWDEALPNFLYGARQVPAQLKRNAVTTAGVQFTVQLRGVPSVEGCQFQGDRWLYAGDPRRSWLPYLTALWWGALLMEG